MINTNTCPHCGKMVTSVNVEDIKMEVGFKPQWKGFSYGCSHCKAILGVQMNPLTLNGDLVDELMKALRKN